MLLVVHQAQHLLHLLQGAGLDLNGHTGQLLACQEVLQQLQRKGTAGQLLLRIS